MKTTFSPAEIIALSKCLTGDLIEAARNALKEGEYDVDLSAHVSGKLKVGKNFEQKQTNKIPWALYFAVALSKLNGVTIEAIAKEVAALPNPEEIEAQVKVPAQTVVDGLKGTTWTPARGRVNAKLEVTKC